MKRLHAARIGAATALLLAGCTRPDAPPAEAGLALATAEAAHSADPHAHHAEPPIGADPPMTGMSLYQLDAPWTDQHGTARRLADLRGRPQVIAMVYTHCGAACPLIVGDMKQLEATFPDLGFVLVSIDPARDTPGRLHEFATGSRLSERWTLLSGTDDQLLELAAVLGVRYRRVSDTDFMHSNIITLLDSDGEITYRQQGFGEIEGTIAAIRALPAS